MEGALSEVTVVVLAAAVEEALSSCLSTSLGEAMAEEAKAMRVTVLYCILMDLRMEVKRMCLLQETDGN